MVKFVSQPDFTAALDKVPLRSMDLCIVCDGLLLGKRNSSPAKGFLFTPDGRLHKNENWISAFARIAKDELGLDEAFLTNKKLMGIWDHFYDDSACDLSPIN